MSQSRTLLSDLSSHSYVSYVIFITYFCQQVNAFFFFFFFFIFSTVELSNMRAQSKVPPLFSARFN